MKPYICCTSGGATVALIGDISIGMRINTAKLKKGLSTARSSMGKFGKSIFSLKGGIVGLIGVLGAGALLGKLKAIVNVQLQAIDRTAKFADEMGLTTQEMKGLELGAGLTGTKLETLEKGLQRAVRVIGEAKLGFGQGTKGLEQLGLKAEDLTKVSTFEALKKISSAIKGQTGPAEKAASAYALFGRQGLELLTFLDSGAEGLDSMVSEVDALGASFTRVEANQVEQANDAILKLKTLFQGVFQQLTIKLAPIITGIANKLTSMGKDGFDAGKYVIVGIELMVSAIGIVLDVVHTLKLGFLLLKSGATKAIAGVLSGIRMLAQGLESLINLIPGVEVSFTKTLTAMSADMHKLAGEQFDEFNDEFLKDPPSVGIKRFFEDIKRESKSAAEAMAKSAEKGVKAFTSGMSEGMLEATEASAKLVEKLQMQINTFGMSSTATEIFKLGQQGASVTVLNHAAALQKQLDALEKTATAREKFTQDSKSVFEDTRTPLENFNKKMQQLGELLVKGGISKDTFLRAASNAKNELNGDGPGGQGGGLAGALDFGGTAARSLVLKSRMAGKSPINKVEQNTKKALDEAKRHTGFLERIAQKQKEVVFKI